MDQQTGMLEINLLDLFKYLKKRIWIILVALVLFALGGYVNSAFLKAPQYTTHTQMYVLNRASNDKVVYSDFQTSTYVMNDYKGLILGQNVTKAVIEKLGLENITPTGLANKITVSSPESTRIMQISVTDTDPQRAAAIANAVREEAALQIKEIMEVDAVKLVYSADVPQVPSSPNVSKDTLLAAVIGLALSVIVLSVIHLMDDTIRTEEDVEKRLGLSVLGMIPTVAPAAGSAVKKPSAPKVGQTAPAPKAKM